MGIKVNGKNIAGLGRPGKSAYELAVEKGYEGTIDEWLSHLVVARWNGTTLYIRNQDGEEVGVDLKGNPGLQGIQGIQGIPGPKGQDGTVSFDELTDAQRQMIKGDVGYYYMPSVTTDGTLSWTNNGGLVNPPDVVIKGTSPVKGVDYWTPEDVAEIDAHTVNYINELIEDATEEEF